MNSYVKTFFRRVVQSGDRPKTSDKQKPATICCLAGFACKRVLERLCKTALGNCSVWYSRLLYLVDGAKGSRGIGVPWIRLCNPATANDGPRGRQCSRAIPRLEDSSYRPRQESHYRRSWDVCPSPDIKATKYFQSCVEMSRLRSCTNAR